MERIFPQKNYHVIRIINVKTGKMKGKVLFGNGGVKNQGNIGVFMRGVFIALFTVGFLYSATYYSRQSGNWNDPNTWSTSVCGGGAATTTPGPSDVVIICSGHTVTQNVNNAQCAALYVQPNGALRVQRNTTILGDVELQGADAEIYFTNNGVIFTANGNFTMYPGSLLARNSTAGATINIYGKLTIMPGWTGSHGTEIGTGTQPIDITVYSGDVEITNNGSASDYAGIGRGNMTFYDPGCVSPCPANFLIKGTFKFIINGAGRKKFRNLTITSTGTFDNANGEDPEIDGNVQCDGSWINCTGGNCVYRFGRNKPSVSPSDTIRGTTVVQMSRIIIHNSITVVNLTNLVINGNGNPGIDIGGAGTPTFINGDGISPANLYLENNGLNGVHGNILFYAGATGNTVYYSRCDNQNVIAPIRRGPYILIIAP